MVTVTVDLPDDVNRLVEHFKIDNGLSDKRDAIVSLLKRCSAQRSYDRMEDIFAEVRDKGKMNLSAKDAVRMKRKIYDE